MTLSKFLQSGFGAAAGTLTFAAPVTAPAQNASPVIEYYRVTKDSPIREMSDGSDKPNFWIKRDSCVSRALNGNDPAPEQNLHIPFRAGTKTGDMAAGFINKDALRFYEEKPYACVASFATSPGDLSPPPSKPVLNKVTLEDEPRVVVLKHPYVMANQSAKVLITPNEAPRSVIGTLAEGSCIEVTNNSAGTYAQVTIPGVRTMVWVHKESFTMSESSLNAANCRATYTPNSTPGKHGPR